jgi:hypothetical protein
MSKYFSEDELRCKCGCGVCIMDSEFLALMDEIREDVGEPIGVVSGYRCPKHDAKCNNDGNHPTGQAIDMAAALSRVRFKIVRAAIKRGIKRIGIAKTFLHLDTVISSPFGAVPGPHPQDVIWLY